MTPLPPIAGAGPGLSLPAVTLPPRASMPAYTPPAMHAPTLRAVADGRWDSAATWGGRLPAAGELPAAGDIVFVPRDRTVELAGATAPLGGLWIDGTLAHARLR